MGGGKDGNAQGMCDVFGLDGNVLGVVNIICNWCGWGGVALC
jgi:hypothetical protein